jgi:hypothetical protein
MTNLLIFGSAQFDNYIANLMKMGKSYCIITDGFWELKQGLREESRSKGVKLGAHFNKFFDIKIEFLRTYPRVQGIDMSLNSMVIGTELILTLIELH